MQNETQENLSSFNLSVSNLAKGLMIGTVASGAAMAIGTLVASTIAVSFFF